MPEQRDCQTLFGSDLDTAFMNFRLFRRDALPGINAPAPLCLWRSRGRVKTSGNACYCMCALGGAR